MNDLERKERKRLRLQGVIENTPYLGPQTVHFDIANGCNVRCTTCWHHSLHLDDEHVPTIDWKRRSMSLEDFQKIMDDLVELGGLEQIILSGMGDPSINRQLPEMVRYAHQNGIGVTIITNLLAVDLPRILSSEGELNLLVSVCGVTEPVWDAFHGGSMAGGFAKLLSQLTILKEHDFRPKHVQVINSQNFHELPAMVRCFPHTNFTRLKSNLANRRCRMLHGHDLLPHHRRAGIALLLQHKHLGRTHQRRKFFPRPLDRGGLCEFARSNWARGFF